MSDRIALLLKMLLPSVALSIAIKYFSTTLHLVPTTTIVLIAILSPSILLAIALWLQSATRGFND